MKQILFKKNLLWLRKSRSINQTDVGNQVDKGHTTVGNWEKGVSEPNISELAALSQYFGISADDLLYTDLEEVHQNGGEALVLKIDESTPNSTPNSTPIVEIGAKKAGNDTGKNPVFYGTMPKVVTVDLSGEENAVFVPVKARAGYLTGYGDPEFIKQLPVYKVPGTRHRTYRIFEVKGNSMFNTLADRDRVNAYWVSISEVRDDRVYVIVTKEEGIVIKRVFNRYQEGKIICTSDNNHKGEYPAIVIDVYEVLEVWEVEEKASKQLGRPGEIYKQVAELKADVILMKENLNKLMSDRKQN